MVNGALPTFPSQITSAAFVICLVLGRTVCAGGPRMCGRIYGAISISWYTYTKGIFEPKKASWSPKRWFRRLRQKSGLLFIISSTIFVFVRSSHRSGRYIRSRLLHSRPAPTDFLLDTSLSWWCLRRMLLWSVFLP